MPAVSVNLPDDALPDLQRIAEMDDVDFQALLTTIGKTEPTLTRNQFAKKLAERTKDSNDEDIQAVLRAAFALYAAKERAEVSIEDLTQAVAEAATVSSASLKFPAETKDRLHSRLQLLLNYDDSLGISVKALDVMTEHERTFCRARILSDIRPVFTDKLESSSAVIIHTLQIGFHEDGRHHDHYFALDTDDIQTLKSVIERAEKKTLALQSVLKKADVRYLEV